MTMADRQNHDGILGLVCFDVVERILPTFFLSQGLLTDDDVWEGCVWDCC